MLLNMRGSFGFEVLDFCQHVVEWRFVDVALCRESETSQVAYITFSDSQGADRAALLTVSSKFYDSSRKIDSM